MRPLEEHFSSVEELNCSPGPVVLRFLWGDFGSNADSWALFQMGPGQGQGSCLFISIWWFWGRRAAEHTGKPSPCQCTLRWQPLSWNKDVSFLFQRQWPWGVRNAMGTYVCSETGTWRRGVLREHHPRARVLKLSSWSLEWACKK